MELRSGVQPEGKAFTLHNVNDNPRQTREIKDGKRYTVVTWFGGISATKAGTYPASLSLNANVSVRDTSGRKQPRPRRRTGGPFDDPFFDSIFDQMNAPMIQKDVTLKSEDQEIEVRALPTEGRPADFTGAVGNFTIAESQIPTEWKTGEPQQIRSNIQGSGNFALMNAPGLTPAENWKTYPGKNDFTPGDVASFSGSKRFQFSAVPRKGGPQELALTFSFFDPEAGTYTTLTSPPSKVVVSGEDVPADAPEAEPAPAAPEKPREHLIGQHLSASPVHTLVPLVSRPAFVRLLGTSAAFCVLGGLIAWFRARRGNPARLAREAMEKSTRQALRSAAACAEDGNVPGFFDAARLALQQHLGAMWNQPAQAITLAEVVARVPEDSPVVRFFREADRQTYSHSAQRRNPPAVEIAAHRRHRVSRTYRPLNMKRNLVVGLALSDSRIRRRCRGFPGGQPQCSKPGTTPARRRLMKSVLAQEGPSAAAYYNLGNARQRLGNIGPAILAYERARLLTPAGSRSVSQSRARAESRRRIRNIRPGPAAGRGDPLFQPQRVVVARRGRRPFPRRTGPRLWLAAASEIMDAEGRRHFRGCRRSHHRDLGHRPLSAQGGGVTRSRSISGCHRPALAVRNSGITRNSRSRTHRPTGRPKRRLPIRRSARSETPRLDRSERCRGDSRSHGTTLTR